MPARTETLPTASRRPPYITPMPTAQLRLRTRCACLLIGTVTLLALLSDLLMWRCLLKESRALNGLHNLAKAMRYSGAPYGPLLCCEHI